MFDEGFVMGLQCASPSLKRLDASFNGTYHASDYDCDGFEPVVVNLAMDAKTATQNGVYRADSEHLVGYDVFTVALQIVSKTINANGTYTASEPDAGYSPVIVRVPSWKDAKDFYNNGGTGLAGTGGRGYVDELLNEIVGEGEHVENKNLDTGWYISIEDATSGSNPDKGYSIHIRNDAEGKDFITKNITSAGITPSITRVTGLMIEPYPSRGTWRFVIDYKATYNGGTTWTTGTTYSNISTAWNAGWTGYLSGNNYSCTVI